MEELLCHQIGASRPIRVQRSVALAIHESRQLGPPGAPPGRRGLARTRMLFRVLQLYDYYLNGLFTNIDVLVQRPEWIAG